MKSLRFVVLCALIVQPVVAQQSGTGSDASARPETSIGMEAHSILGQQMSSQAMLLPTSSAGRAWIEPRAGYIFPTRDLGRTDIIDNQGFGVFEDADPTAVLGLGAGVDLGSGFAIRASADWTLEASVNGEWRCAPFVACPAVLLPLDGNLSR